MLDNQDGQYNRHNFPQSKLLSQCSFIEKKIEKLFKNNNKAYTHVSAIWKINSLHSSLHSPPVGSTLQMENTEAALGNFFNFSEIGRILKWMIISLACNRVFIKYYERLY